MWSKYQGFKRKKEQNDSKKNKVGKKPTKDSAETKDLS